MKINDMRHLRNLNKKSEDFASLDAAKKNNSAPNAKDNFAKEGLATAIGKFVKDRGHQSALRIMQELNVNDLNRSRKNTSNRMLNLSDGTALLFALDQRVYEAEDDFVKGTENRQAITQHLQQKYPDQPIRFIESAGVAEAGTGYYATIPVFSYCGATIAPGFGFLGGIILRYRSAEPLIGNKNPKLAFSRAKSLPMTAGAARLMSLGQEFEICGQGKIRGDITLGARYGADAGLASLGVGISFTASAIAVAEYSLTIISLNGDNKVRVLIRKIDQETTGLSFNAPAGLIIPTNRFFGGNTGLPQLGHGLLKYFADHKGNTSFESYLTDFTSLTLNGAINAQLKHTHICAYDLDLNYPEVAAAYNSLMKLDIRKAKKLSACHEGVVKIQLQETQKTKRAALRLSLFSEKLFFSESLRSKSHGEFSGTLGDQQIYRDRSYKKHKENWFTNKKDILWETVHIAKKSEEAQSYFHFNYQRNNFITRQKRIDTFFDFAKTIGVVPEGDTNSQVMRMHTYKKFFSTEDDTKLIIDIFFNPIGIARMRRASQEEVRQAFLKTLADYSPHLIGHPSFSENVSHKKQCELIFKSYQNYDHAKRVFPNHVAGAKKMQEEYNQICGRTLREDYKAWKKSNGFAKRFRQFTKIQSEKKVNDFFTSLGKGRHPHYTKSIPTLALLAGRENVIIHTFSASGGGVALTALNEGSLLHPREEMVKTCWRVGL